MTSLKYTILFSLFAMSAAACHFWQGKPAATTAAPSPLSIEEVKSDVPFATKEPEVYQTEIHVSANNAENVIFTARNGANRLIVYDYQTAAELAILQSGGKSFLINRKSATCAENQSASGAPETEDAFPTAELLNEQHRAVYESLGAENGAAKYLIRLDDSPNSEILITVDESINLPVRQEFYSGGGERKNLISTTELKNFSLNADARNFDLPKNCKQVSPTEFQAARKGERKQ